MKILKTLFITLLALVGILLVVGIFLPRVVTVESTAEYKKPPEVVYDQVVDFRNYNKWNPWTQSDPDAENIFSDPSSGVDAQWQWEGDDVGTGRMKTIETRAPESIKNELYLMKDAEPSYDIWKFEKTDKGTKVTWKNEIKLSYPVGVYMGLFLGSVLKDDQEQGLKNLGTIVKNTEPEKRNVQIKIVQVESKPIFYINKQAKNESEDIQKTIAGAYRELGEFFAKNKLEMTGQPITITNSWQGEKWDFDAAFECPENEIDPEGNVKKGSTYKGKALKAVHIGPYEKMNETYEQIGNYIEKNGLEVNGKTWEVYVSDPGKTTQNKLITHIYYPVK